MGNNNHLELQHQRELQRIQRRKDAEERQRKMLTDAYQAMADHTRVKSFERSLERTSLPMRMRKK